MHTRIKTIMLAGLLGTTLGSLAQTAPSPAADEARCAQSRHSAAPHHRRGSHVGERGAQHLAQLKAGLALEPQQESAWQSFAATLGAEHVRPDIRPDEMAKLSTPERLDKLQAMRKQREARMDQIADATRDFYKQLKPEQQAKFDESSRRFRHGPRS